MSAPLWVLVFLAFLIVVVWIRWLAGGLDRERIREYLMAREAEVISIRWAPFGPGHWGTKARIYDVRYADGKGNVHDVYCKTSAWAGVYFTDDRLVSAAADAPMSAPDDRRPAEDPGRPRQGTP